MKFSSSTNPFRKKRSLSRRARHNERNNYKILLEYTITLLDLSAIRSKAECFWPAVFSFCRFSMLANEHFTSIFKVLSFPTEWVKLREYSGNCLQVLIKTFPLEVPTPMICWPKNCVISNGMHFFQRAENLPVPSLLGLTRWWPGKWFCLQPLSFRNT